MICITNLHKASNYLCVKNRSECNWILTENFPLCSYCSNSDWPANFVFIQTDTQHSAPYQDKREESKLALNLMALVYIVIVANLQYAICSIITTATIQASMCIWKASRYVIMHTCMWLLVVLSIYILPNDAITSSITHSSWLLVNMPGIKQFSRNNWNWTIIIFPRNKTS